VFLLYIPNVLLGRLTLLIKHLYDLSKKKKGEECLHAYVSITKAGESFLKQKARNQWLQLGDQNNSFFHRSLRVQNVKNTFFFFFL
jgi:hypothetical protein